MEAEAKVYMKSLTKQAEGYKEVVSSWWRPNQSVPIIVNRKLPELVKTKLKLLKISKLIKSPYGIQVTMATTEQDRLLILFLE
jgi:hypothetical protein